MNNAIINFHKNLKIKHSKFCCRLLTQTVSIPGASYSLKWSFKFFLGLHESSLDNSKRSQNNSSVGTYILFITIILSMKISLQTCMWKGCMKFSYIWRRTSPKEWSGAGAHCPGGWWSHFWWCLDGINGIDSLMGNIGDRRMVGLDGLGDLFQPWQLYDSMILWYLH